MIHRPHYDLYIASCDKEGGIYHYKTDALGNARLFHEYHLDRPMYMKISGDKLHCVLREPFAETNKYSGVVSFQIEMDGSLTQQSEIQSTKGIVACHLTNADDCIYCVNYLSGNVIKMPDTVVFHTGCGTDRQRQDAPHPHYICESPDGKYILVTDLGLDKIFVYKKDLVLHSVTELSKGFGPRHLVCHPNGRKIYCVGELASAVTILDYKDGILVAEKTVSTLPVNFYDKSYAAAIRYRNKKIYVTNRGHNSITVLNEELQILESIPCGGIEPRDIWLMEDMIICTNQFSDKVCFISEVTGKILFELEIKAPVCAVSVKNHK